MDAARRVVALHATDPATIVLAARARSGSSPTDVERALQTERSLVTAMAMRRTIWILPGDLVDRAGNAGPTVWSDGRIVGGWHQNEDGSVGVVLLSDVGRDAASAIHGEAAALEEFLGGRRVLPRFPSPLFRHATGR